MSAAIRILERLAAELPRAVSPTALVNELGLNRSTCYNILTTLQRAGWVNKLESRGGWTLGPGLLALTGVSDDSAVEVVQEEIDNLSRRLGYVVFAARQDGSGGYTVIAVSDPRRGVRVIVDVGDRFPFSAPALMQAMYAHRPFGDFLAAARSRAVERFTEHTVVDLDELAKVFSEVRRRGFSTSVQQFNLAQSGTAAPVFDRAGKPHLAVGTLAFSSELDEGNIEPVGRLISATAGRITDRTGGTYPPEVENDEPEAEPAS
ncbi:IclR family transcriptional regulator [Streptomyces sp. NPDC057623]|uniref:IclR family transcriptional regulator n=1 Tax=Streptomyces sp. NPDC057623 TaxID=3346187 RepID=UPI0036CC5C6D